MSRPELLPLSERPVKPARREALFNARDETRIPGVFFLSGDRRMAQMFKLERQGLYPIHEITTSPLTAGPSKAGDWDKTNADIVPGTIFEGRNFAMITVSGARTKRELAVEVRDTNGEKRWEWKTTAAQLAEGTRA